MNGFRILIVCLVVLTGAAVAPAGIRPSFLLENCSWRATDIVVVTEGEQIDGVFQVLEIVKGDLKPGQTIKIPEMAEFKPKEARLVNEPWHQTSKSSAATYVTGERMVLFLIDSKKIDKLDEGNDEDDVAGDSISKPNASRWRSANTMGDELKYSTVWIEKGEVYSFIQVVNPGDSLLVQYSKSERAFRDNVAELVSLRHSFDGAITNGNLSARAESLEPFVRSSAYPVRDAAFKQLIKCGKAALPVLQRMLADESLAGVHPAVIEALGKAGGKTAGPDLTQVVTKELGFWKSVAPSLKPGWWNGEGFESFEAVERFRDRYSKVHNALEALREIRYRESAEAVRQLRDYWRSTPQLGAELDQISELCNEVLRAVGTYREGDAVVPNYEIQFTGNRIFSAEVLKARFHEYVAEYGKLAKPHMGGVFDYARDRLGGFLWSLGYWDWGMDSETGSNARGEVLSVELNEGKLCRLGEISIEGAKLLTATQIRAQLPLDSGAIADGRVFNKWLTDLESSYKNQGYLEYSAEDDHQINPAREGHASVIDFKITIVEGRQFKVGSIKFHGQSEVPDDRLRNALVLHSGELYSEEKLKTSIEQLERLGLYIDSEEDVRFSLDDEHQMVNVVIVLDKTAGEKGFAPKVAFSKTNVLSIDVPMQSIFGPDGLIAKAHPEYEHRPGQIEMAEAVLRAFEQKRHLIVEAGTGTGKTLAYLVPAVAAACGSGARVVISTGTKNLQEQLMDKDIPFLQGVLPAKFRAALMKGRNNYACLHRIKRAETSPILEGLEQIDQFDEVFRWVAQTETGDRAELSNLPENLPFWRHIDARSDTCLGQKCPDYEPCFITRMRQRAIDADVIVVNHHLFFADLALRNGAYGAVLPDYAAVILDEAHQIEDVASEYFGAQISNYQVDDLLRDVSYLKIDNVETQKELSRVSARISRFADLFWVSFPEGRGLDGRFALAKRGSNATVREDVEYDEEQAGMPAYRPQDAGAPVSDAYRALDNVLHRLETTLDIMPDGPADAENLLRRTRQMRFDLNFIVKADDKQFVYWLERRGRGTFLRASPIDVSGLLQDKLFEKVPTVVLTSATLSSAGNFRFIRERLGLDESEEMIAESIFDFENQAVLYLPEKMPDPRSPQWGAAAAAEVIRIVNATEGRAFVLSTSFAGMNELYERVASQIDYPCFLQGTTSKSALLKKFRATPNAVLFATSSFWQGVDVRGEQLSCVIIDKLPFAVPSDPIIAARQRSIDDQGGSSFNEYSVPQAVISLKQGLGRLIRSTTDRGVLAVLDPRLRTKMYGKTFLKSLPPCRVTSNVDDLVGFFAIESAASA